MPKKYEAIRDNLIKKEGLSAKIAKQRAARIFNATRKPGEPPVTRASDAAATTADMVRKAKSGKGTLTFTPKRKRKTSK